MVHKRSLALLNGSREDAEEAYGRVALLAFENCPAAFNDADHAKAWLLAITRNVCMDLHRERRRAREVSLDAGGAGDVAASHDPEHACLDDERSEMLRHALTQLPQRLRRTAELHLVREMSYRDIARELCITEVNVRKRMQHTREVIRRMIVAHAHGLPAPAHEEKTECPRRATTVVHLHVITATGIEREAALLLGFRNVRHDPRSITRLVRYIESHPSGWKNRLQLARLLIATGSLDDAMQQYRFVVKKQPFLTEVWVELGKVLEALDRMPEAADVYAEGAAAAGRETDRLLLHALSEAARGDREAARTALRKSVAIDAAQSDVWRELGALLLRDGHPLDAVCALQRAAALDTHDPLAIAMHHDALMACGRADAARASLNDASDPLILERVLFHRLHANDDGEETRTLLLKLRHYAPERAATAAAGAWIMAARGRIDEAIASMDAYTRRHAANPCGWLHKAALLRRVGRAHAALHPIDVAVSLEPARADLWLEACRIARIVGGAAAKHIATEVRRRFPEHAILVAAAATLVNGKNSQSGR